MTPEQFCYWLQGRAELMPDTPPTCAEWKMIAEHLATVFKKVTPPLQSAPKRYDAAPTPADLQRALDRNGTWTIPPSWQTLVTC